MNIFLILLGLLAITPARADAGTTAHLSLADASYCLGMTEAVDAPTSNTNRGKFSDYLLASGGIDNDKSAVIIVANAKLGRSEMTRALKNREAAFDACTMRRQKGLAECVDALTYGDVTVKAKIKQCNSAADQLP